MEQGGSRDMAGWREEEEQEVEEARRLNLQRRIRERERGVALLRQLEDKLQQQIVQLRTEDARLARAGGGQTGTDTGEVLPLLPRGQPETREDFLRHSLQIHLDPNTAHRVLLVSGDNRTVSIQRRERAPVPHPDRFTYWYQVLGRESLTGRRYWEVEWRGQGVFIAVSYGTISRTGGSGQDLLGFNTQSWALKCDAHRYVFWRNKACTPVPGPWSSRVGVYLDHTAGLLSFYSVSGTMTLLHRVQTRFSQPLHAGVWLLGPPGGTAEFIDPSGDTSRPQ